MSDLVKLIKQKRIDSARVKAAFNYIALRYKRESCYTPPNTLIERISKRAQSILGESFKGFKELMTAFDELQQRYQSSNFSDMDYYDSRLKIIDQYYEPLKETSQEWTELLGQVDQIKSTLKFLKKHYNKVNEMGLSELDSAYGSIDVSQADPMAINLKFLYKSILMSKVKASTSIPDLTALLISNHKEVREPAQQQISKLQKISQSSLDKTIKVANYLEHVVRLFEGKNNKYSSVQSALEDFAQRLGLDNNELKQLKKQAFVKMAQLEQQHTLNKLEDEGITDPKAVSYMAKQKNKHTDNTSSPFSLNKQKAAPLIEELKKRHPQEEAPGVEDQTNELGSSLSGGSFASLGNDALRKIAEEFGKILPFGGPSQEALEDLKSELGEIDLDTPYKAARFGFNFTNLQGGFPKPNTPIKVTTYQYSFLKDNFVKIINDDLKKHLAQEMPFDQWIAFLEEKIKSKEIHHTEGWDLVDKLKKMQRQLFGDETTAPYSIDETAKRVPTQVRNILKWFPVSYREKILRMLAEGKYRHILTEASGREHANVFPTSYARSSFVLMDSFAPYSAISIKPDKDLLKALLTSVVTNKKQEYSNDEFKTLLDSLGIKYTETPATREYQVMPLHSKIHIKVENSKNSSYKPLTFDKDAVDVNDKEALLEKFNDHLFNAIREDIPLAYEVQSDGSAKELKLSDLGGMKKDLTLSSISHKDESGKEVSVPNPKAGMHTSFEGSISQKARPAEGPKDIPTGISFEDMSPTVKPKSKKEQEKPSSSGDFDFADMLEKMKAKKLKGLGSVLNILQKYASSGLWMDGKGRSFDSEENLRKTLESEMIQESASSIVDKAVQMSMSGLTSAPESPISKQPRVIEEAEEDKLPLAANTILRLRIVASKTHNSHLKTKINQIINKTRR